MPISSSDIPADVLAAWNDDLPLLAYSRKFSSPKWTAGSYAATTQVDDAYPISRLSDSTGVLLTKPTSAWATGRSVVYLPFLVTGDVDVVMVCGHNLSEVGATSVRLELASEETFATPVEVASWSAFTSQTLYCGLLASLLEAVPQRFSGATHGRLKISKGSNFTSSPGIGEILLGTRAFLPTPPAEPFEQGFDPYWSEGTTGSGATVRASHRRAKRTWRTTLDLPANDDCDTLLTAWLLSKGRESVGLVLHPRTAPEAMHTYWQSSVVVEKNNPSGGSVDLLWGALPPYV